jgi:MSHA biogenesis protein MshL
MRNAFFVIGICFLVVSCVALDVTKEGAQAPPKPGTAPPVKIPSPVALQMDTTKKAGPENLKEVYTFSLREADVKDVLRSMGWETSYNMVIEPDVKGLCTVDLKNVTVEKALQYILEPLNYTFKIEGRTVYVSKPKVQTRIFYLDYISLRKTGTSSVMATQTGSQQSSTTTTGATTTTAGQMDRAVDVRTLTDADLWKHLEENLKKMLSPEGHYIVNQQAMLVLVNDYPRQLNNFALFFDAIKSTVHRQVMIEAKIIEVTLNDTSREGVNWNFISGSIGEFIVAGDLKLMNPIPVPVPSTSLFEQNPYFRFHLGSKNLNIDKTFIDLLKTQGSVNILSSPKVSALNNQRAIIKVAKQDVYFEEQQTTTGGIGALATYTPRFITIGLVLDVIPQIDDSGNILLNVHPMVTEKVGSVKSPSGNEVPVLDVREADAMVRLKDGETVIIAGLIKDRKIIDYRGIPGLMYMPIMGPLFRVRAEEVLKQELIVFITPRIVYDGGVIPQ